MSFNLSIEIGGLCAFVPEGSRKMHVLMPETLSGHGGGYGNHKHQHALRLLYDVEYEHAGRDRELGVWVHVPLDRTVLDLSGLPSDGEGQIPELSDVLSLNPVTEKGVPRSLVEGDEVSGCVGARLTLGSGQPCAYTRSSEWNWADSSRRWAVSIRWVIPNVAGRELRLNFTGNDAPKPRTLHPIDNAINLIMVNALPDELPPFPAPDRDLSVGEKLPHFYRFLCLVTPTSADRAPTFQRKDGLIVDPVAGCSELRPGENDPELRIAFRTATCIVVQARLQ